MGSMEPTHYQGMEVEFAQSCKGTRYHNLWWINEKENHIDCVIQFYLYLDALCDIVGKVPHLFEERMTKYWWIARFAMGPHIIHIQARCDGEKQWFTT